MNVQFLHWVASINIKLEPTSDLIPSTSYLKMYPSDLLNLSYILYCSHAVHTHGTLWY